MSAIRRRLTAKASISGLPIRTILLATVVAVLAVTAQASGTSAMTGQGNAVTDWNEIAQNAIVVGRPTASSLVLEGIVQAAVYDAVVAIEGGSEPFVASPTVLRPASTTAAVAAAARGVLVARVPGQAVSIQAQYEAYLSSIPDGEAKTNGIAVGEDVAEAILAWRAGDGFDNVVPYVQPTPGPGVFEPVAPTTPIDVKLKQVRPLTYGSLSEFRPDGPNPLTSAEYAEDFNEVKAYGRADSSVRTPEQTEIARFWAESAAVQAPRTLRALAIAQGLGVAETARMLAMVHVAGADALLACFDSKYYELSWRPLHAIQRADTDGNPATVPDPTWTSLLTVNHPEYPSAHGCFTKAMTDALTAFFGADKVALSMSSTVTGTTRYYDRFSDVAKEVYDARVWAGLHFRNSVMEGAWIGRKVAAHVVTDFFQPTGTQARAVSAAAGPVERRQRVAIDMKIAPKETFVFSPLQAGALKRDSGRITTVSQVLAMSGRDVTRDGQKVTIFNGALWTLKGKRGTLTIRERSEWVDVGSDLNGDGQPDGVAFGAWKVVRGTGQYAKIAGGGRSGHAGLGRVWTARQEGFLATR
jgi:PAP2 superfamily